MFADGRDYLCGCDVAMPVNGVHAAKQAGEEKHEFGGFKVVVVVVDGLGARFDLVG